MMAIDDDWCVTKVIFKITHDKLKRVIRSLSIREKKEFAILTTKKFVALVQRETLARP